MPAYQPTASPFDSTTYNAFRPQQFQRYEPFGGSQFAQFFDFATQAAGIQGKLGFQGLQTGTNQYTNLYNNLQQQMYSFSHQVGMQRAWENDAPAVANMIRGGMVMAGKGGEYTTDTQQRVLDAHRAASPLAMQITDPAMIRNYDIALGGRTHFPLEYGIRAGGRMQTDPFTGLKGMSASSATALASEVKQRFYDGGDQTDFSRSSGLRSHEMAELYQELSSSGRMPSIGSRPGAARMGREGAGKEITDTLAKYARLIGTVKEIFAQEGRPDAPLNQIADAVEALSGGTQQMGTVEAEKRIRGAYTAAKSSGVGLDALVTNMQATAAMTQAADINQVFAAPLAQYGFEFRRGNEGVNAGTAWGLRSSDQLMMQAQEQRARFVGSRAGNQLGATRRLMQRYAGDEEGNIDLTKIDRSTPFGKGLYDLAAGNTTSSEAAALSTMNASEWTQNIARTYGITTRQAGQELTFDQMNQAAGHKYGLEAFSTGAQGKFFWETAGMSMQAPIAGRVQELIGDTKSARAVSGLIRDSIINSAKTASVEVLSDETKFNELAADNVVKDLQTRIAAGGPDAAAAQQLLQGFESSQLGVAGEARAITESALGAADAELIRSGRARDAQGRPINLRNYMLTLSPEAQRASRKEAARTQARSMAEAEVLGLKDSGGIIARMMTAIQAAGKTGEGTPGEVIQAALGGDISGKQAEGFAKLLTNMDAKIADYVNKREERIASGVPESEVGDTMTDLKKELELMHEEATQWLADPANAAALEAAAKGSEGLKPDGTPIEGVTASSTGVSIDSLVVMVGAEALLSGKVASIKQEAKGTGSVPA